MWLWINGPINLPQLIGWHLNWLWTERKTPGADVRRRLKSWIRGGQSICRKSIRLKVSKFIWVKYVSILVLFTCVINWENYKATLLGWVERKNGRERERLWKSMRSRATVRERERESEQKTERGGESIRVCVREKIQSDKQRMEVRKRRKKERKK